MIFEGVMVCVMFAAIGAMMYHEARFPNKNPFLLSIPGGP